VRLILVPKLRLGTREQPTFGELALEGAMINPNTALIACENWEELVPAMNRLGAALPWEDRRRLHAVFVSYLGAYGLDGAFDRMAGRTVAQVLAEYRPPPDVEVIAGGEREGVRYTLLEAPTPRDGATEPRN
jgi:hypothetical protein